MILKKKPSEELRVLFSEIIKGFSFALYKGKKLYLKHLNILDSSELDLQKNKFHDLAISKGLDSYEEKEDYIIKENLWSEDKNKEIENIKSLLSNLKITKSKFFKQNDIEEIKKQIELEEKKLKSLFFLKNQLMGLTAEEYSIKKTNAYFIYFSLYKDENLNEKFFSEIDYEDLSEEEIDELTNIYNVKIDRFSNLNLKRVGLSSFFLNLYNISNENPKDLYGKPIVDLTYYQIEIFHHARYFKNILSDSKHKPPKETLADPDALIEWVESSNNADQILNQGSTKNKEFVASSIVGANKQDISKIKDNKNVINIHDVAKAKGGTLNMEDFLKMHKV